MVLCKYAVPVRDLHGRILYRCTKHNWLIELDLFHHCRRCKDYVDGDGVRGEAGSLHETSEALA